MAICYANTFLRLSGHLVFSETHEFVLSTEYRRHS